MGSRYVQDTYQGRSASAHPPYNYQVGRPRVRSDLTRKNLQDYNEYAGQHRGGGRDEYYDERRPRYRRRSSSRSNSSSRSPPHHRSRNDRKDRRPRSEDDARRDRRRSGEDFVDRNFDTSFNGLIAAAAGAGVGAFAARRAGGHNPYRPDTDSKWRSIGGATAGAAVGNVATKKFTQWSEREKEEKRGGSRPR